jgi:hypothetical protein
VTRSSLSFTRITKLLLDSRNSNLRSKCEAVPVALHGYGRIGFAIVEINSGIMGSGDVVSSSSGTGNFHGAERFPACTELCAPMLSCVT